MQNKTIKNTDGRILVIGDLHGCYEEALAMLELCKITERDTVIFTGDLVDRGPDNSKCVDLSMKHECIIGNHESKHIKYDNEEREKGRVDVKVIDHIKTREQLRPEHYDYFKTLPYYIRLPQYNALVVHAGVFPGIPIELQSKDHLLHIQMIEPPEPNVKKINKRMNWPRYAPEHWKFWTRLCDLPERVIFGHSVLTEPLVTDKVVGIDGGCCFGHQLWAVELPSWKIYKVQSKMPERSRLQKYVIHGAVETYS